MDNELLKVSEEVKEALTSNKPLVALESTIISHGMPYPQNVETALNTERVVRENGAIPATIAILNGQIVVGASKEEIDYLGRKGKDIPKASSRDIPILLSKKWDGATTVAGTAVVASLAGIEVLATGGIGGVHRGCEKSMDISTDLEVIANTQIIVVCAGAKSILDLGLTLEYLETKGVPVIGYKTKEFPAFYTQKSGFFLDYSLDEPAQIANAFKIKNEIRLKGGMIIANPIPKEFSMDYKLINQLIDQAIKEAQQKKIRGKEVTPFLLSKITDTSGGESLKSNIQLVYNNAKLAAQIACELHK